MAPYPCLKTLLKPKNPEYLSSAPAVAPGNGTMGTGDHNMGVGGEGPRAARCLL